MKGKPGTGSLEMPGFLDYCASQGLAGAELTAYFFPESIDFAYCRKIKRQAHLLGIDLTGGAIGNNFTFAPGSDKAKEQLEYTKLWIDRYAEMGIPAIRVFAGNPGKDLPIDQAIPNIIANLSEALVHAETRGVLLGMENHDFTTNVERFVQIVSAIDSPWLGSTFDSGNVEPQIDPYEQMERLAPYAITAQIKAMIKTTSGKEATDFVRVLQILKRANYRGYIVLEYEEEEDPYQAVPRHLESLRKAMVEVG
jgi:sugar phosphate isomerase/epimerase